MISGSPRGPFISRLDPAVDPGGVVDMRYLERAHEGSVRLVLVGRRVVKVRRTPFDGPTVTGGPTSTL